MGDSSSLLFLVLLWLEMTRPKGEEDFVPVAETRAVPSSRVSAVVDALVVDDVAVGSGGDVAAVGAVAAAAGAEVRVVAAVTGSDCGSEVAAAAAAPE